MTVCRLVPNVHHHVHGHLITSLGKGPASCPAINPSQGMLAKHDEVIDSVILTRLVISLTTADGKLCLNPYEASNCGCNHKV